MDCFWMEGDPYKGKDYPLTFMEYNVIVGLLYKQLRAKKIPFNDFGHIIEYEIELLNK